MKQAVFSLLPISICTFGYLIFTDNSTTAQVIPDNTVNTQVDYNGNVAEITGGETRRCRRCKYIYPFSNDIDASSEFDLDGDIILNTPDVDPTCGVDTLPTNVVDASRLITRNCLSGDREKANEFVVTGRGGIPSNPTESLQGNATLAADWLSIPHTSSKLETSKKAVSDRQPSEVIEAKGWIVNHKGNIVLTAAANDTSVAIPWIVPNTCRDY